MVARRRRKSSEPQEDVAAGQTDREALLASLSCLKPAIRVGGVVPELAHIWFTEDHVSAYDGGLGIRLPSALGLSCGVPGSALLGLLKTSSLRGVELEQADSTLAVKMGRSRTKLNVLEPDRDPWQFETKSSGKGIPLGEAVIEALRSVLVLRPGSADNRLEHHGIAVYRSKSNVDFYSTDNATIARATIEEKKSVLPSFLFLPRPFAEQLVSQCPAGADLYVAEDHFVAVGDGVELYSNALDTAGLADLPAIAEQHLDEHPDEVPMPTGLEAALDRAEVLVGADDPVVTVTLRKKEFHLGGKYAYGALSEKLKLEQEHPDAEIVVAISHLRRALMSATTFSATEESMLFFEEDRFLFVVASRS